MTKRLTAAVAATGAAASLLVVLPASSASAKPIVCERGHRSVQYTGTSKGWVVTHKDGLHIPKGGQGWVTEKVEKERALMASVTVTAGSKVKVGVLAKLEAEVGIELKGQGEWTTRKSREVKIKVTKPGRYVFYSGVKKASGVYRSRVCNNRGDGFRRWSSWGHAKSWDFERKGAVRCKDSYSRKSLEGKVKRTYC
ncbi:hypothetical protein [Streptomyces sp. MZ04]|uniref:hypothetical protein n=1 Tax=Streptomyces sp. MZ04 TaxID=2559236 RepID=UPI00107E7CB9|nr:hypothetical protein [Streptomyces sp. MZ04]TGB01351.1 hypothetical protein E2651_27770 [Streptomyces sp. MZ04]